MLSRYLNIAIPVAIFIAIIFLLPYTSGYEYDRLCWQVWGAHNYAHGLSNAYSNPSIPNGYMPVYNYLSYMYFAIASNPGVQQVNIVYLKLVILAMEWLSLWYVYKWTGKKIAFYWLVLISMLNLGFSYNNLIWAQIDGMVAAFLFISFYYGHHRQTVASALFFILALNTKVQAVVFLPVWGFFYLQHILERRDLKSFAMPLLAMAAAQFIILIPFLGKLPQMAKALDTVDTFQYVTVMAFNYWHIMVPEVWNVSDREIYIAGLTYKQFGLLAFCTFSLFVLFPMLRILFFKAMKRDYRVELSKEQIWLICALLGLGFFFFNTQMHERYCHPAIIFLTALAVYRWYYIIPYLVFSLAYFANMERTSHLLGLPTHTALFDHVYIAYEFLFVLLFLLARLLFTFRKPNLRSAGIA